MKKILRTFIPILVISAFFGLVATYTSPKIFANGGCNTISDSTYRIGSCISISPYIASDAYVKYIGGSLSSDCTLYIDTRDDTARNTIAWNSYSCQYWWNNTHLMGVISDAQNGHCYHTYVFYVNYGYRQITSNSPEDCV